jgi:hypothetical protein
MQHAAPARQAEVLGGYATRTSWLQQTDTRTAGKGLGGGSRSGGGLEAAAASGCATTATATATGRREAARLELSEHVARFRAKVPLKGSYTSSLRPHTFVA